MTKEPLVDYAFLEAFHDGTVSLVSHDAPGYLVLDVDIEYLRAFLGPGVESIEMHLSGCSRARSVPYAEGEDGIDLLDSPAPIGWELTLLSVENSSAGSARIFGVSGELELRCAAIEFTICGDQKITKEDLMAASHMYWTRWSQRNKAAKQSLGIRLAKPEDSAALGKMYGEHLDHLARFNPLVDPTNTLQADWFEKPGKLFPWLMVQEVTGEGRNVVSGSAMEEVVGFALTGGQHLARAMGSRADYLLFEFYVSVRSRRLGIGGCALGLLFDRCPGTWCLDVLPGNPDAQGFWGTVLEPYRPVLSERVEDDGARFTRYMLHTSIALRPLPNLGPP